MLEGLRPRDLRETVLLVIGVSTPIAVLAVNFSAYVMRHLGEIRTGVAVAALISGLLLNGLTAYGLRVFAVRAIPHLYAEYRTLLIILAAAIVVAASVIGAYLTYVGLRDPTRLPDRTAVLVSFWVLVTPFVLTYAGRRFAGQRRSPPPLDREAPEGAGTAGERLQRRRLRRSRG